MAHAGLRIDCSRTLLPQWLPGQQGVLSGRNMGPLGADFPIDLTDDNALQLPTAHAGLLALPEPPSSIKDKVSALSLCWLSPCRMVGLVATGKDGLGFARGDVQPTWLG